MTSLPEGWASTTLGAATLSTRPICYGVLKPGPHDPAGVPLLRIQDLAGNRIARDGFHYITRALDAEYARSRLGGGEVLLSIQGTIGRSAIVPEAMAGANISRTLAVIAPDDSIDRRFLYFYFRHLEGQAHYDTSGSTRASLNIGVLRKLEVPVPPLAEQRRIVAAIEEQFSRLDAALASLQVASRRLNTLRRSVLARAIDGDWPVSLFEDIIVSLRNGIFASRPAAEPPGIPIFRISAVRPLSLNVDDVRFADIEPERAIGYLVQDGDLLFTRYSGNPDYVGACARVAGLPRPTLHPDKLIRVVIDPERAESAFVAIALSTGPGRQAIEGRLKTTAGQVGIAGSELKKVPIPLPPLEVQTRIVAEVEQQMSLVNALSSRIAETRNRSAALRRSILERAFTGNLVPQDPADEAASVLLERLAASEANEPPVSRRRRRALA